MNSEIWIVSNANPEGLENIERAFSSLGAAEAYAQRHNDALAEERKSKPRGKREPEWLMRSRFLETTSPIPLETSE